MTDRQTHTGRDRQTDRQTYQLKEERLKSVWHRVIMTLNLYNLYTFIYNTFLITSCFTFKYDLYFYFPATLSPDPSSLRGSGPWWTLLPVQKLSAHRSHFYTVQAGSNDRHVSHVRITMAPDGGISRMRLWGYAAEATTSSKIWMTFQQPNHK